MEAHISQIQYRGPRIVSLKTRGIQTSGRQALNAQRETDLHNSVYLRVVSHAKR